MSIEMVKAGMNLAFGKCPRCSNRLTYGKWLRWCTHPGCRWIGPQSK